MELVGRRFGHIRVTEVVGSGGMGDVYAGYDDTLERKVALKVLNADQRLDDEARERLLREARALSRLDHPNICRIHDYIDSGDVDLLVLEYIDGRTLNDAIEGEAMSRGEKLRIAVAIAEVLVQAHRAGIVHRDLKPDNVMLTTAGEVKVLDFGLARWLNRARIRSSDRLARINIRAAGEFEPQTTDKFYLAPERFDTPHPSGGRKFLATEAGITLGTPLYMSPEQARGESLTPASDMFAFGLLLQVLFTGEEPHPLDLSARMVMLRAARGDTLPVKGAPHDVTALINRLKHFAPADRPTAVEVSERLRFLDEKPQRIARRSIVAALAFIAALGGWRYTVDLKTERAIAVSERTRAENARAEVENLFEFMLGDLRKKLQPVGRLEVLDDVAQRALVYFSALKPAEMTTAELVRNSNALNQLGEVRIGQGNVRAALDAFAKSLQLSRTAVQRSPRDAETALAYATSHFWVANAYRLKGELPKALSHAREYMQISDRLAQEHPAADSYQFERAAGHDSVGVLLEAGGDIGAASAEYRAVLAIQTARLATNPGDPTLQDHVASARNKLGAALLRLGRLNEARPILEQEFATYAGLHARNPENARWRDRLANSHSYLAFIDNQQGDTTAALAHRNAEQQLWRELTHLDPQNAQWQRNLATTYVHIAALRRQRGDIADAQDSALQARDLLAPLVQRDLTRASWKIDVAVVDTELARIALLRGDHERARTIAGAAVTTLEALAASEAKARLHLAAGRLVLGEAQAAAGLEREARDQWLRALELLPGTEEVTDPLAKDYRIRALLQLGRKEEARTAVESLRAGGYRNGDLERLCAARGV